MNLWNRLPETATKLQRTASFSLPLNTKPAVDSGLLAVVPAVTSQNRRGPWSDTARTNSANTQAGGFWLSPPPGKDSPRVGRSRAHCGLATGIGCL